MKYQSLDLSYMGVEKGGFEIELEMEPGADLAIEVTDQSRALPAELEHKYRPRPPDMIPMPNFDYACVLLKTFKF